jgi:hypothetical protein
VPEPGILKDPGTINDLASPGPRNPVTGEFKQTATVADKAANEADAETASIRDYGTGPLAVVRKALGKPKNDDAPEKPEGKW